MALCQKRQLSVRYWEEILDHESGETLEHFGASITSLGILGSVQGQSGWGFQQPVLVKGVLAHSGGVGT